MQETDGENQKITRNIFQDVVKYEETTDSIASTNKEKELYVGNKKIASDVVDFSVNGKEIAYINNSNEVYIVKDGATSEKVIDNAKQYKIENETIKIEKVDNDTINITLNNNTNVNLKRISEEEYNKNKAIVDKVYPKAKELYKEFTAFEGIEEIAGKTYYKYASDEGDIGSLIYFDADGNMFSYLVEKRLIVI